MPQAVQIETQSEQQGLTLLRAQRATRRAGRELALYRTEQTLDQGSTPVKPSRKCSSHLGADSMNVPGFLSALRQGSRSAPRVVSGCKCGSSRCRTRRRLGPSHCAFARKPPRRLRADSHNRSSGRVLRSATTGTVDPNPPRPPTSTNVSTAAVFARDDACAA